LGQQFGPALIGASFGELRFGSLTQAGKPNRNRLTERTESNPVWCLRLERIATGVTGCYLPGAIGNPKSDTLAEVVQKLERQLGREISYTVLTRKELKSRRDRKDSFLENVWHNKRVLLVGAA
jgi:hypothetical protein